SIERKLPIVAADEGIHPTERRAPIAEQSGDIPHPLRGHHGERAACRVAVNVDREFVFGELTAGGFLDRFFERSRPCRHAIEKLAAFLGAKRYQSAVVFALGGIL